VNKPPRPLSLYDFRMEGVSYELITLAPREKILRKSLVAGYFYNVINGSITVITDLPSTIHLGNRDTISLSGLVAHEVCNESDETAEILVGAEPYEFLSWLQLAPIIQVFHSNRKHPIQKRLLLAMDLVIEEISHPDTPPDQLTLERTAELIIFYFFRMANPIDGSLDPFPWSDSRLMAAIEAMNADPARDWTVDQLAKISNMSRSAFSERFHTLVGDSPIRTLATIRLKAAARKMLEGESVSSVAVKSGYGSEEAFNRAFKRQFNVPPGRWLRNLG
jgi:AraC-like DNA-binding protein